MREYSKNYLNPCSIEGCERRVYAKSACLMHYLRFKKHGDYEVHYAKAKPKSPCRSKDCERLSYCRGLCKRHYRRRTLYGRSDVVSSNGRKAEVGEYLVCERFRLAGHKVERVIRQRDGDLRVGPWLIEVKCADPRKKRDGIVWSFNIHRHGRMHETSDYYSLCFRKIPFFKSNVYAALPSPIGKKVLTYSFRNLIAGAIGPGVKLFNDLLKKKIDKAA